ncbi:hypothetical protein Trydic_g18812 [Trypoxylus dichotomus]
MKPNNHPMVPDYPNIFNDEYPLVVGCPMIGEAFERNAIKAFMRFCPAGVTVDNYITGLIVPGSRVRLRSLAERARPGEEWDLVEAVSFYASNTCSPSFNTPTPQRHCSFKI